MQLELAEHGNLALRSLVSKDADADLFEYILVPDPQEINPPIFVRADLVSQLPDESRKAVFRFSEYWNSTAQLNAVENIVQKMRSSQFSDGEGGGEGTDWTETVDTVVDVVDTVVDWFGGGDGTGTGTPAPPGSVVSATGFVACAKSINGQLVLFGVHPQKKQLIAFSAPQYALQMFPNLPTWYGNSVQYIQLPALPDAFVNFALQHPNKVVRKYGSGYQVVPDAHVVGYDNNGNPAIYPPPPADDGDQETASTAAALIPLAIAGLLFMR